MALTNYERVKRWREKNRALYNLQRRNRRKTKTAVPVLAEPQRLGCPDEGKNRCGEARESTQPDPRGTDSRGGSQSSKQSTLAALRALMAEPVEHPVADSRKPLIFKDDYGRVITAGQWEKLQEKKRRAKEGGYTIDDYSQ